MPRNIIIFSDGTGQRGGLLFDERRSNIYKLYRATRCAPDSSISPADQLAFYDPGVGTLPPGLGFLDAVGRKIYNLISQATGLGLTRNIVDCYAAIIALWRPGDRIFLFGFSRGAYTVRCLAAVADGGAQRTSIRAGEYVEFGELRGSVEGNSLRFLRIHCHRRRCLHRVLRRNQMAYQSREDKNNVNTPAGIIRLNGEFYDHRRRICPTRSGLCCRICRA